MGQIITQVMDQVMEALPFQQGKRKILMVGLQGCGKSTIMDKIKFDEATAPAPAIAFNCAEITYRKILPCPLDVGGQANRAVWSDLFKETQALIFVVDSANHSRIPEAKQELHSLLHEDMLAGATLLVFANKVDLPGALPVDQLTEALDLKSIGDRQWFVQPTRGTSGEGIYEGLDWLARTINTQ